MCSRHSGRPEGPIAFTLRDDLPEQVFGTRSTADVFEVLRVRPQLGTSSRPRTKSRAIIGSC